MTVREPVPGGPVVAERATAPPGDPVRELMEQHRTLCEHAVDALEIAAGLEDSGLGTAEAARYRHVDVFALAEELYARVPRRPPSPGSAGPGEPWRLRVRTALRGAALQGLSCGVLVGVRALLPSPRGLVGVLAVLVCGGLLVGVSASGAASRRVVPRLGYGLGVALLLGVPLLVGESSGVALGLAVAVGAGSVEWSVGWLRHAVRIHLGSAGTLADFRSRMRPILPVTAGLHLTVLAVLGFAALAVLTAVAPRPGPGPEPEGLLRAALHRASGQEWSAFLALGLLLALAAVLSCCGRPTQAAAGLLAAGVGSALLTVTHHDPATARLLCCGGVAAVLFPYGWVLLGRPGPPAGSADHHVPRQPTVP